MKWNQKVFILFFCGLLRKVVVSSSLDQFISCEKWSETSSSPPPSDYWDNSNPVVPLHYTVNLAPHIPENLTNKNEITFPIQIKALILLKVLKNDTKSLLFFIPETFEKSSDRQGNKIKATKICHNGITLTHTKTNELLTIKSVTTFDSINYPTKTKVVQVEWESGLNAGDILKIFISYKLVDHKQNWWENKENGTVLIARFLGNIFPAFILRHPYNREEPKIPFKISVARPSKGFEYLTVSELKSTESIAYLLNGTLVWDHFSESMPINRRQFFLTLIHGLEKDTFTANETLGQPQLKVTVWAPPESIKTHQKDHADKIINYMSHLINRWNISENPSTHTYHVRYLPWLLKQTQIPFRTDNVTLLTAGPTSNFLPTLDDIYADLATQYLYVPGIEEIRDGRQPDPNKSLAYGVVDYARCQATSAVDSKHEAKTHVQYLWETWDSESYFQRSWDIKGVILVKLLEGLVTKPVLDSAILDFYRKLDYGCPSTEADQPLSQILFTSIEKSLEIHNESALLPPTNVSLEEYMKSWIDSTASPNVLFSSVEGDVHSILVSQKVSGNSYPQQLNWIPITIFGEFGEHFFWLPPNGTVITNQGINTCDNWMMVDFRKTGAFFRVLYDKKLAKQINQHLDKHPQTIPGGNKLQYISNYLQFFKHNHTSLESVLDAMAHLNKEVDVDAWEIAHKLINIVKNNRALVNTVDLKEKYAKFLDADFKNVEKSISQPGSLTGESESDLIHECKHTPYPTCINKSKKLSQKLDKSEISLESIPISYYCPLVRYGSLATWELFFIKAKEAADKKLFTNSLACTSNTSLINALLDATLPISPASTSSSPLSNSSTPFDPITVYESILENFIDPVQGCGLVFGFLKRNLLSEHLRPKKIESG